MLVVHGMEYGRGAGLSKGQAMDEAASMALASLGA
jgi:hypothetical protein